MAKTWTYEEAAALTKDLYNTVLERSGQFDDGGLVYWASQLARGEMSVRDVALSMGLSKEYANKFIDTTKPRDAVKMAYVHFLGRDGEDSGVDYWTNTANNNGMSAVIKGIVGSDEYTSQFGEDRVPKKENRH